MPKYILTRLTCILAASCLAGFTRLASADRLPLFRAFRILSFEFVSDFEIRTRRKL
jgi:hypothetical protein